MLLNDLYGWYQRNLTKWSTYNKRKAIEELKSIIKLIEDDIRKNKTNKGGVQHVNS